MNIRNLRWINGRCPPRCLHWLSKGLRKPCFASAHEASTFGNAAACVQKSQDAVIHQGRPRVDLEVLFVRKIAQVTFARTKLV